MKRLISISLASAVVLMFGGCASAPKNKLEAVAECVFPNTTVQAPLWVCDAPIEGVEVAATGRAEKSGAGLEFMKQMGATAARVQLAQRMKVRVQNMVKQYAETTGAGSAETVDQVNTVVTKQITDQSLEGSRIYRTITSPDGALYVLVGLDKASVQKITENSVKTSMKNDQAQWQQFKAKQGQDELAAAIASQEVK